MRRYGGSKTFCCVISASHFRLYVSPLEPFLATTCCTSIENQSIDHHHPNKTNVFETTSSTDTKSLSGEFPPATHLCLERKTMPSLSLPPASPSLLFARKRSRVAMQKSLVASNDDGKSATFLLLRQAPHDDDDDDVAAVTKKGNKPYCRYHHYWLPKKNHSSLSMAFIVLLAVVSSWSLTSSSSSSSVQAFEVRPSAVLFQRPIPSPQQRFIATSFSSIPRRHSTWLLDSEVVPTIVAGNLTESGLRVASSSSLSSSSSATATLEKHQQQQQQQQQQDPSQIPDVPMPTENGGYTHTTASRAKISAANKGKTPWNKGRERSPEERERIAAGVRARNRERFLAQLAAQNMTEAEYEAQKADAKRKKAADKAARRTEKGGYRPTAETRQKISRILKEKHARGEVKRTPVDPSKVRRGFTHSEETRRKISESLKKRWANDEEYRENMLEKSTQANAREATRRRISESLRQKWQDPEFREKMLSKISNRASPGPRDETYRERISQAMKLKWKDEEYRKKTLESIARRNEGREPKPRPKKTPRPAAVRKAAPRVVAKKKAVPIQVNGASSSSSLSPSSPTMTPLRSTRPLASASTTSKLKGESSLVKPLQPLAVGTTKKTVKKKKKKVVKKRATGTVLQDDDDKTGDDKAKATTSKETAADGSVSRLYEERRDLYDLLYGDEEDASRAASTLSSTSSRLANLLLNDENLDTFDPYGLDDF